MPRTGARMLFLFLLIGLDKVWAAVYNFILNCSILNYFAREVFL